MRSKAKNINSVIGLVPPQAIELEEAILGAIMLESESIHKVVEMLSLDCFYKESNKVIFKAIVDLLSSSEPIDLLTVTTQLRKNGDLETAGGAFFVTELTSKVSSAANIEYHCKIIYEYYIKRKLISLSSEVQRESFSDESDSFNLISKIESEILNITKNLSSGSVFSAKSLLIETFKSIEDASKKPNGITGIPTLLPNLDRVIGGWQNSDLIIIAARPAMGKTDFALNILVNASKAGYKGAIFSLEMSKEQLMSRLLAISCEIDREKIKKGNLDSSEWMKLTVTAEKHLSNVFIADEPTLNTFSFRSKARRLKMKENVSFIVVDYLQLMSSQVQGSTNDKVSDISRTLKLVAKELNIPIIALSQLSRSVETSSSAARTKVNLKSFVFLLVLLPYFC
jgi:replicative DNA helicase